MTAITWTSAVSGDWSTQADWNPASVPGAADTVTIAANSASYTITVDSAEAAETLALSASNATLEVENVLTLGGLLSLGAGTLQLDSGGVISGGTVAATGGILVAQRGTLDGVTYRGVLALTGVYQSLFIEGGLTLETAAGGQPGSIDLSAANSSGISVLGSGTLNNATLNFDSSSSDTNDSLTTGSGLGTDSGHTLTLGSGFTIDVSGGSDYLGYQTAAYNELDTGDTLDNAGLIDVSAGELSNYYGTFKNTGSIIVSGSGGLDLVGTVTTAQLGRVTVSGGGALEISGLLINTGATLDIGAGSALGTFDLNSGDTILGGTVLDSGSGLFANGGTLDGVTYRGVLALAGVFQSLFIEGGLTLETAAGGQPGSIDLSAANSSVISVLDSETLNNAALNFDSSSSNTNDALLTGTGTDSGNTLTLGSGFTIDVSGGNDYLGYSPEFGYSDPGDTLDNAGLIDVSGGELTVDYGTFSNTGSISISGGGVLNLPGTLTTAQLGRVTVSDGGALEISGLLVNTGATLDIGAGSALGTLDLTATGAILGGTVLDSGSGLTGNGGTLDGVTYRGVLALAGVEQYLFVEGGLTLETAAGGEPGSIDLSAATDSVISVLGSGTLANATLNFGGGVNDSLLTGSGTDSGNTLTLGGGFTIDVSGGSDYLGYSPIFGYSDPGDTLDNAGLIDVNGGELTVDYGTFSNTGSISISGGGVLNLPGTLTTAQLGRVTVSDGGALEISGLLVNTGATLDIGAGSALGTLDLTATGAILGGTVLDSGSGLTGNGGTLDGVTYRGVLALAGVEQYLFVEGGLTLETAAGGEPGSIDLSAATDSVISVLGSGTLANATLNFGGGVNDSLLTGSGTDSGNTLTLGGGFTIDVSGGSDYLGYSPIFGYSDPGDTLDNAGLIDVNGGELTVDYGTFSNTGSISISGGGVLNLPGTLTTAQLGRVTVSDGGALEISGLLVNTGATLDIGAGSALGTLDLTATGAILGGTVLDSGSGLTGNGGTLDGVTYRGVLALAGVEQYLFVEGGLTLETAAGGEPGSIDLSAATDSVISVLGSGTLANATLNFGGGVNDSLLTGSGTDSGNTLTLGGGFTIDVSGGSDYLGYSPIFGYSDPGDTLDNAGLIDVNGGELTVDYGTFSNTGSISISGGGVLNLPGTLTTAQLGRVTVSGGGALEISGLLVNTGATLDIGAGSALGTLDLTATGAILGGTVLDSGSGLTGNGGTLDGVTYRGVLALAGVEQYLFVEGGLTLETAAGGEPGSIDLSAATDSVISVLGSGTLANATLNFGGGVNDSLLTGSGTDSGNTLTLGGGFTIDVSGGSDYLGYSPIFGYSDPGDTLDNAGLIDVNGGELTVDYGTFSNTGSISISGGGVLIIGSTKFANLSGTTLNGGSYEVDAGSTLQLQNNLGFVTDNANITLSGTGSVIEWLNTTSDQQITLDSKLTTIGTSGTLGLLNGRNFTTGAAFTNKGLLELGGTTFNSGAFSNASGAKLFGYGTFNAALTDTGSVEASGGLLKLASTVTGTGGFTIDAGAELEFSSSPASGQVATFNGLGATLKMDVPASFGGTIGSFSPGDTIDLAGITTATGAVINGNTLTVSLSSGGPLVYTVSAPYAGDHLKIIGDGGTGDDVIAYGLALPGSHVPEPVNLGDAHVGASANQALSLMNTAPTNNYYETLDASVGGATAGVTAAGSFSLLAAGATDSTHLVVGLDTSADGNKSGTATITLTSDGTGVDALGITAIGTQTVNITGTVYNFATATAATPNPVNFGEQHVGVTLSQALSIENTGTTDGFTEKLDASINATGAASANGSFSGLAAGVTNASSLTVGLSSAHDGAQSGTAKITLTSDGAGIDTLGTTALTAQTVTVEGTFYNYATASAATPNPVNFGEQHVGAALSRALSIKNTGTADGFTEKLDASINATGAASANGSFSGLAAGVTNASSLTVGLSSAHYGVQSGTAKITLTSDGAGIDTLGTMALTAQTVTVEGTFYNYATASAATPDPVNFGEQHVGATLSQALSLTNLGTVGSFTEKLDASIGSPTGSATTSGGFTGLAAGASNSTSLTVGLNSALDGAQSGKATIALTSDGAGVDTLGTTPLAAQTITVEGTLYNYAAPILSGPSLEVGSSTTMLAANTDWGGSLGGLIEDANGDLFGTTRTAGVGDNGTVFEIANTSTGYASTAISLVNFTGPIGGGGDGDQPEGGLLANAARDLFGTTYGVGSGDDGTVFELANTSTGYASTPTTLATFNGADGIGPLGSLIKNAAGDLFGETQTGGAFDYTNGADGAGTVFEIANTSTGYASTPITLVSFTGALPGGTGNGYNPTAGLAMDAAGDLFGSTSGGGAGNEGSVFEIANTSTGYASTPTALFNFTANNLGYTPEGGVLIDAAGDLFGTASAGGESGPASSTGGGVVWELVNTDGVYTPMVLANFPNGNIYPLSGPVSVLTEDAEGDLFGTTNGGALFEIVKTNGTYASTPTLLSSSIGSSAENSGAPLLNAAGDLFVATYGIGPFEVSPTYTLNFGEQHVGAALSQALSITNHGTADGFTESLDASIGSTTGSATASGSFTHLAAGITNSSSLIVDLNSGMAGVQSGTATVTLTSDGSGVDTLGTTALAAQTITVEGTLYNYATASAASPNPVNFGIVHVGTAVSETLSISNRATAGSFSEKLDGSIGNATGGVTAAGSFTGLAASATNTTSLAVGLNTANAGTISGMATITLVSDGAGIDTLGTTVLAAQTVAVSGIVNNYATAAIEEISGGGTFTHAGTAYTLALGTIDLGAATPEINLGVINAATGPADLLGGSFTVSGDGGGAFINTLTAFSSVAAGNVASGDEVSLSSSTAGAFSETITLLANGSNSSGYLGALPEEVITVTGSVVAVPRTLIWTGASDTNFANASNWDDTTSGLDPATLAPTTLDTAEFSSGGSAITGTGTAAMLLFDGAGAWHLTSGATLTASSSVVVGSALPTVLLIDQGSSLIDAGSAVIANTTTASGSSVTVTGAGSDWGITGTLEVGNATAGTLDITSGATVSALDVTIGNAGGLVSVGASSELRIGTGGELTVNGTLANFGAVSGGGATEVAFGSGTDRLIVGPDATFGGTVVGGGSHTTLELAAGASAGTLNALGTGFTNFGTVTVDAGATWTVDAVTSSLPSTTFIGDGTSSTLVLNGAVTFSLATVSNFGTIDLPTGNNTVTVTDKTLSGGSVTINDGASGNNSVSAASDTAASKNKTLTYDTGAGTDKFTGGFENDTVAVSAAAVSSDTLTGGSGTNTLVLTSAGALNLSGASKFRTIDLAAGNNTVTVTDALLSVGSLTINDGASGNNTIGATSDTSASKGNTLTYNAGTGTDNFTGGFENDTVNVSAAAVGGDTLTGGSGANILTLTSAGIANLGGVSKFGTINLAAGNSTVTITDTTLSGGTLKLNDGASGNNTVSAAGDTSASKGKTLNYFTGPGTDNFTGGFENDTVHVSAAAVGGDVLTGGSGANALDLTTAGGVNLGGVSKFGTINLAALSSTVTITDTTLSGGTVVLNDGATGNDTVRAVSDTSASTGKILNYFTGTGTDSFTGGFENDTVHVSAALVGGDVLTAGSGVNTLDLTSAGTANLGRVSKFGKISLAAGNNTVTLTATTLSGGTVVLNDGASGNDTVSAAGDTSASKGKVLNYFTGPGTDSFTGGFENATVHVSAAAVGSDTLTGGSGTNTLVLTSAGTVNLAGISKFGAVNLAAGNNTVTMTDTTLSGGSVTINDGASGNNTVSAAGDTSASKSKVLTYITGTGTDSFTGGFENDAVHVSAAAVGGDVLTGGSSGVNTLTLTTAGSANLGGVSKFQTIDLAAGNSTVTVTDTTLSGGAVTINDGASGNNTVSAVGDTSASAGKTLTYKAGKGADSFTGNFENDTVNVSAAAVGGDVLTGGSGVNILTLTSAGAANLGGVSKFGTINLAALSSTVTMTDTTLSGGTVKLNDGASGNNTVSLAGDTSASKGKTLNYFTGSGTDSFTGGFENDTVHVAVAAVGGDVLTAGSGANALDLTSAGTANLGRVRNFRTINLAAGNSTVTLTDTTLSGGTVVLNDGASGNSTVSTAGDTSASKGKVLDYFTGAGTDSFTGGFENDTLHVSAAAVGGDVLTGGSGTNALDLTSAGSANLGGVSKFGTINLAAGNNTVTLTDTTLSGGTVVLNDGASGNDTVTAAGDTAASKGKVLNYFTGPGTDSFTGGFENATVHVSAAAVGGDVLTGGSGTNTLVLTSAGTVNLGGVSRFGTINLAAGTNTATVTDTTLSGGSVTINAGSTGNDTISAAGDTAASKGTSLTYNAGSGTNGFTGGFENDTIYAGTGSGSFTAGSGSDIFVFIKSNLPNQTLNNFQVSADDILVYGTHASGGFNLGSTDNPLNPTTPTAIDPSIFVANVSGDFTSSSQRFAYDTSNGQLFYSATGSNSSESLIATLTGEPHITAGNLLFEH